MLKHYDDKLLEVGCDEAGRGCLAGPVYAAAVILPKKFYHPLIKDSKILNLKERLEAREVILNNALYYSVAICSNEEIDRYNILNASIMAMHKALKKIKVTPNIILVDGNKFKPYRNIKHICVIKGDAKYLCIAAASILAKTYRDEYMRTIHTEFPQYNWQLNKGYPTKEHRLAVEKNGITKYHRKSFGICKEAVQLKLF